MSHRILFKPTLLLFPLLALALLLVASPALAQTGGSIGGFVYFDSNGDGLMNAGEPGLAGVSVAISGGGSLATAADGSFLFSGLAAGTYTLTQTDLPGFLSTTPNQVAVAVTGAVSGIDFGDALPHTVTGVIFEDLNEDGDQGLGEPGIPGALLQVYRDNDGDGVVGIGDPLLGADVSDVQGNYRIPDLPPGPSVVYIELPPGYLPGGASTQEVPLPIISSQIGANTSYVNFALIAAQGQLAQLGGRVWIDADGDEQIGAGESYLSGVVLALVNDANGNSAIDAGETKVGSRVTGSDGAYAFADLTPGAYVLVVDAGSVPAGYLLSQDPGVLAFTLAAGEQKTLDLGFFDPTTAAPLQLAAWKQEVRQIGKPIYSANQIDALAREAEGMTALFPTVAAIETVITGPAKNHEEQARKQYAALLLNVASDRLLAQMPISLPGLTTAVTVAGALSDIEAVLWPPAAQADTRVYLRVTELAKALNQGKGLPQPTLRSARHNKNDVTAALRATDGVAVRALPGDGIYLRNWYVDGFDAALLSASHPRLHLTFSGSEGMVEVRIVQTIGKHAYALGAITPNGPGVFTVDMRSPRTLQELSTSQIQLAIVRQSTSAPAQITLDAATITLP